MGKMKQMSEILLSVTVVAMIFRADAVAQQSADPGRVEHPYLLFIDQFPLTEAGEGFCEKLTVPRCVEYLRTSRVDAVLVFANGVWGYCVYPSQVNRVPEHLKKDAVAIWRDAALAEGLPFYMCLSVGKDKAEILDKPHYNRVQIDGTNTALQKPSYPFRPYNYNFCPLSGVAEAFTLPQVREVMRRYQPDGFWVDGTIFLAHPCFCPACKEAYAREFGKTAPTPEDIKDIAHYRAWQRTINRDYMRRVVDLIRELNPKCRVGVNSGFMMGQPEEPAPVDYLTRDTPNVLGISERVRFIESQGLPFSVVPAVERARMSGESVGAPLHQLQQQAALLMAHGGMIWPWVNPLPDGTMRRDTLMRLGQLASWIDERRGHCYGYEGKFDVSILHAKAAHYRAIDESPAIRTKLSVFSPSAAVPRLSQICDRGGWLTEITPDWRLLKDRLRSHVIVVPDPDRQEGRVIAALHRFAEGGDVVLVARDDPACVRAIRHKYKVGDNIHLAAAVESERVPDSEMPSLHSVLESIFQTRPRLLKGELPSNVHVTMRDKDQSRVVHFVNVDFRDSVGERYTLYVKSIPHVDRFSVALRCAVEPKRVRALPAGEDVAWSYEGGYVTLTVPGFHIHQMLEIGF